MAKVLFARFIRGFVAGALGAIALLTPMTANSLSDLSSWLMLLIVTLFQGGVTGGLLALDKWIRMKPENGELDI